VVESVEKADTRRPKGANDKWQQKAKRLTNVQRETYRRYCIFGKCIASVSGALRSINGSVSCLVTDFEPLLIRQ
jgi:hypothetical protein